VNVLVVGGGGREHALCHVLASETTIFCAPGNPGTAEIGTNLPLAPSDLEGLYAAILRHHIDLTVIGPEGPLAEGVADHLRAADCRVFGPSAAAARIEASKAFAKAVMSDADVPTAASRTFSDERSALAYVDHHAEPLVVKASGLAAGKGAIVCPTRAEAADAVRAMFGGRFGDAGREVVIEEFLVGEELSVFALTNGEQVALLPAAQDHKRLGDGDTGPNTGGMGAYTPVTLATPALLERVTRTIIQPTLKALDQVGARYEGVLYAGLMIAPDGSPSVVEFNCRFGDPETQVVLPVADTNLIDHLWAIAAGEAWRPAPVIPARRAAVTTVVAAAGYPETPVKGAPITLPETTGPDELVFHAGTARDHEGQLRAAGGRVLCATGFGPTVAAAAQASRRLAERVAFEGCQYRRDIAWREIGRAGAS
jgi:phosphoribosylamine--glycine ligase